ncbi:MAG: succinylglutamate desuccinylase/aspartoacylase family protein [gamma proteobacterium symbiont of Bathyaustriella thionipta]|nr:succinylglutamate desuccinylase/aspartoacylase family protein [gamma proteobacterium symbiont of Bathyaustriella thionipta]
MKLSEFDDLPDGLLQLPAQRLCEVLTGPSLIHLSGRRAAPLFLSVLMHGNEDVGWEAVRSLLQHYTKNQEKLPRSLSLFIGNIDAAAAGLRHLPEQPDYNRVWPGTDLPPSAEQDMMTQVVQIMRQRKPFASVDLHNNTGLNPHYACINDINPQNLHLATLFSRTVVYFVRPLGVQSMAMSQLCPAVTLECGKVGQAHGVDHAREYIQACLHLSELSEHPLAHADVDLFHTVAVVKVSADVSLSFEENNQDLTFANDLDHMNFRELPAETCLADVRAGVKMPLRVCAENGDDVTQRFFNIKQGQLFTRIPVMPSMLTRDTEVIRQDCLCYLMERLDHHALDRA